MVMPPVQMRLNVNIFNVVLTGVAFLFLFTAFQTSSLASQNVLEAAAREGGGPVVVGIGYVSLSLLYASFAICNWFAPVVILLLGHKYTMFAGSLCYVLFVAAFLEPQAWSLYLASILNGLGAAILWTAQGAFITLCSDESNSNRNFSIFWALFQMSQVVGGLYAYFSLSGIVEISRSMRHQLFGGLLGCGLVGALLFLGLRPPKITKRTASSPEVDPTVHSHTDVITTPDDVELPTRSAFHNPTALRNQLTKSWNTFCRSFTLLRSKVMLAILVASGFVGVNATFQSSLFATCLGHTLAFGSNAKSYIGLVGVFVGIGAISGSLLMQLRCWIPPAGLLAVLGYPSALISAFLCLTMLPADSPMVNSDQLTYFPPSVIGCMFVATLFGIVDSVWNTQISVLIGNVYNSQESDVPVAFSLFRCVQSILAAITFAYCSSLRLPWHVLLYVIWASAGLACFFYAHWAHPRQARSDRLL